MNTLSDIQHSEITEHITPNTTNEGINKPFSVYELRYSIKKLKNNKSPDVDQIINEFLKNMSDNYP